MTRTICPSSLRPSRLSLTVGQLLPLLYSTRRTELRASAAHQQPARRLHKHHCACQADGDPARHSQNTPGVNRLVDSQKPIPTRQIARPAQRHHIAMVWVQSNNIGATRWSGAVARHPAARQKLLHNARILRPIADLSKGSALPSGRPIGLVFAVYRLLEFVPLSNPKILTGEAPDTLSRSMLRVGAFCGSGQFDACGLGFKQLRGAQ